MDTSTSNLFVHFCASIQKLLDSCFNASNYVCQCCSLYTVQWLHHHPVYQYTIVSAEKENCKEVHENFNTEKRKQNKIDIVLQGCAESQNLIDLAKQMEAIALSN